MISLNCRITSQCCGKTGRDPSGGEGLWYHHMEFAISTASKAFSVTFKALSAASEALSAASEALSAAFEAL